MSLIDLKNWLKDATALNLLDQEILDAIAPLLQPYSLSADQNLVQEKDIATNLYILQSGKLERLPTKTALLPGVIINLQAIILDQPVRENIISVEDCQLWFLPADMVRELVGKYPQIMQVFSQYLESEVAELSSQLLFEQERQIILRPYLIPKASRAIMGKSRYGVKLRSQIKEAFDNRQPVLIFGEPGLEKDNMAALVHFRSDEYRKEPLVKINCATLQSNGADLFGRQGGSKLGLLEALDQGTLILNNLQELPVNLKPAIAQLIGEGTYYPVSATENSATEIKTSQARIIAIAETTMPGFDHLFPIKIKVPPLRVRKADIEDYLNYFINIICRRKGIEQNVTITPEALRRLQTYDFPNNLRELDNLVNRAITQLEGCTEITEDILWPSQAKKKQFRLNLLNAYPNLRKLLRSDWWPTKINYYFTAIIYPIIIAILFFGPQTRAENFALNIFWAWWWPLILVSFLFVGRLWCAFCPFMIYGEITQKISLWLVPRQLKKWPRQSAEKWGGWFLFGLFALILLWEELWDLPNTAYLSACLLLLITAGAMICSAIFERRFWCRYLCPIGGMNGMFAKLSITELRSQQGICSAECSTYQCYKGGPMKGEGQATNGCPLYSHPAQLEDNRDCVLCMTCLKACPHRSVEVNLRPPGIELWTSHIPRIYEVALLFLLLNNVFLRRLPEINQVLGFNINLDNFNIHSLAAIIALSLPTLIPLLAQQIIKNFTTNNRTTFLQLAYGYLPLVLAGNLAHYLTLGLGETGTIIPLTFATFGLAGENLPVLIAHPAVIAFLQGTTLIFGVLTSIILTQKIARQPLKILAPQHLSTIVLASLMWLIIVGY